MRKSRVKWLRKYFGKNLDPTNPKHDFRLVKRWWTKMPTTEKQELAEKVKAVRKSS